MGQGVNECWKADVMAELSINAMIDQHAEPIARYGGNTNGAPPKATRSHILLNRVCSSFCLWRFSIPAWKQRRTPASGSSAFADGNAISTSPIARAQTAFSINAMNFPAASGSSPLCGLI
jgi:hypothetical protein